MKGALRETDRRRAIQEAYNKAHGIIPRSAKSAMPTSLGDSHTVSSIELAPGIPVAVPKDPKDQRALVEKLRKEMFDAAAKKEFERAATLRDTILRLNAMLLEVAPSPSEPEEKV